MNFSKFRTGLDYSAILHKNLHTNDDLDDLVPLHTKNVCMEKMRIVRAEVIATVKKRSQQRVKHVMIASELEASMSATNK
jgi:hypothetical protein